MLEPNLRTDISMGPRGFGKTLKCFKNGVSGLRQLVLYLLKAHATGHQTIYDSNYIMKKHDPNIQTFHEMSLAIVAMGYSSSHKGVPS